ncbi:MAG TPA: hypothetical protein P5208_07505, partial [Smithellaceae bacterium]|nr:hypothetical protein [Smithellaceae bacterium]
SAMKRTAILLILILAFLPQVSEAANKSTFPKWVHELRSVVVKTFRTEVHVSHVKLPDPLEKGKHFTFCLKGNGSLGKTSDPFETMERMFSAHAWRAVPRYRADGHGSSSFAYEKGNRLCNIYVTIDSSCDDEETGHVPSKFWFEIYCRDEQRLH